MRSLFAELVRFMLKRPTGFASPWLTLTVVCATAAEGLEPDQAFAMRGMVIKSRPIEFNYTPPGSFVAYFGANDAGRQAAEALLALLKEFAAEQAIPHFGACAETGDCLATLRAGGGFSAPPAGEAITRARSAAIAEAGGKMEATGQ